jgi:hypothetical protein
MSDTDPSTRRRKRAPAWLYMLAGAVVLLLVYGFLSRRGMLHTSLWDSPIRAPVIALLGAAIGWFAYKIDSRAR